MTSATFVALVGISIVACFAMAWALGASSNSPPFAPAIGANAVSIMRAALLIGILAGAGALVQGGSISETVGSGLIRNVGITPLAATAGLLTAASYIGLGVYTGYPIPAAFAVTGAMVGVGLSLGGDPAVETYRRIGLFWLSVPIASSSVAYLTATLLRHERIPETVGVPLLAAFVSGVLAHIRLAFVPSAPGAGQGTVAGYLSRTLGPTPTLVAGVDLVVLATTVGFAVAGFWLVRRRVQRSIDRGTRTFLLLLGSIVAFSGGGSQIGLATGPLEQLFRTQLDLPIVLLRALGGTGILLGAWMGSPRLLQATAREYAELGVRRSIASLVPGFVIAQTAITLGIPISFNNIMISAVIGGGLAAGSTGVSGRKIAVTLVFWLLTLVTSVGVGFGLYRSLSIVLGSP
jgi:phosphate/sulfate permease